MRILIIGGAGFIGANLARYAFEQGHEVITLCRSGAVENFNGGITLKWAFGAPIPAIALEDVDCAFHLAHDFSGAAGAQLTLNETLKCVTQLREAGVGRQIFFSSYSAGDHATSLYGQTKLAIEQSLAGATDIVIVRPGLVLGTGGIYGRICKWARRLPLIPLPDGGYGLVPVITIEKLCRETLTLAANYERVPQANLFEKQLFSLRQLVLNAAAEVGHRPWIIFVPASLIVLGLRTAKLLNIPIPVNEDSLTGFLANQAAQHVSTLED
ncbi:MAG: NADH-binding protein [Herbaspirillum sp.]|nr:NADH-binding protein [Herbaspirillum sp.]